jgi:hypothetical protein
MLLLMVVVVVVVLAVCQFLSLATLIATDKTAIQYDNSVSPVTTSLC